MPVAILPARGSSKRLPRKNVRSFLDRPALSYPVEAAIKSAVFDRILVSTEDEEIAAAAEAAGAEVINRPPDLATDDATMADVCRHALGLLDMEGIRPESFCCLYATALLILPEDLRGGFERLQTDPATDAVIATAGYNMTPLQAFREGEPLKPMFPEYSHLNTRHHPKLVGDAGAFYWIRTASFERGGTFFPTRMQGYHLPKLRVADIDTEEDWMIAECLMSMRHDQDDGD